MYHETEGVKYLVRDHCQSDKIDIIITAHISYGWGWGVGGWGGGGGGLTHSKFDKADNSELWLSFGFSVKSIWEWAYLFLTLGLNMSINFSPL